MADKRKIRRISVDVANVAVVIGLILLAFELRQNTDQLSLELKWQVNQKMFENNRDLQDEYTASIYAKTITNPEDLTADEIVVASGIITNLLNVWEDRYFLYEEGMLEESEWKEFIDNNVSFTLGNSFAQSYWHSIKGLFQPELVAYVDSKLPAIDDRSTYRWLHSIEKLPADSSD